MTEFEVDIQRTDNKDSELKVEICIEIKKLPKECRECTENGRNTAEHVNPETGAYKTILLRFENGAMVNSWLNYVVSFSGDRFLWSPERMIVKMCCPAHWLKKVSSIKFAKGDANFCFSLDSVHTECFFLSPAKKEFYLSNQLAQLESTVVKDANDPE